MSETKKGAVKTRAEVQQLVASKGAPSKSHKRLARLMDGEVFTDKVAAKARRSALRRDGKKTRFTKANLGGEIIFVVKEL